MRDGAWHVVRKGANMAGRRKQIAFGVFVTAAASLAAVLFHTSLGGAARTLDVVPLAKSELPAQAKGAISAGALADGVDPATIDEVGGFGTGTSRRAALVGRSSDGLPRVSFFQGFGMTFFQSPARLFARGEEVAFSEGFVGPQYNPTAVRVVGATKASVDRLAIELADGTVIDAPLVSTSGLRFFAYTGESPGRFPKVVRAYDDNGALRVEHEIPEP